MSNLQSVLEAYAGRSKELIECEGYLREIITLINNDRQENLNVFRNRSVYRDAEPCKRLEETLTKFFGVNRIKIYWDCDSINACTLPASSISIMQKRNMNSYSSMNIHIVINEQLVYYAGLNEQELMAVLLHEIGHNFYYSPILVAGELLSLILMPFSIIVRFIGKGIAIGLAELDYWCKKHIPFLTNITETIRNLKIQLNSMFRMSNLLIAMSNIMMAVSQGRLDPVSLFIGSLGQYGNERGADSFAAKYGYGTYQASALNKLTKAEGTVGGKIRKQLGSLGDISNDIYSVTLDLVAMLVMDEHPNNNQRASSMLKKLERDLRDGDYPPELKKELEDEVIRMRKVYNTMNDNEGNISIRKNWYNIIDKFTNGHSDLREIFDVFYKKYEF